MEVKRADFAKCQGFQFTCCKKFFLLQRANSTCVCSLAKLFHEKMGNFLLLLIKQLGVTTSNKETVISFKPKQKKIKLHIGA